jgi:predicted PurR-regulated permease PerM
MRDHRNQPRPADSQPDRVNEEVRPNLALDILGSLGRYLRGQLLIAAIMTGLYAVGFVSVGVPFWWLAALLCGPSNLVPFLGAVFAAIIPVSFVLIAGGGFWPVIYALLVFAAVQLIETLYLTPKILGRELSLHPLMVFAVVLAGALVAGPLGALVAAPIVAVGLLIWRRLRDRA